MERRSKVSKRYELLWAFKWKYGGINIASIKLTKREVVLWAENLFDVKWKDIKKHGHSVVKVELKEVKP